MAVSRGPSIVRDGLKLCLDAADKNSYPGTGATWYDLSGNNNNGTLVNSPTFDSNNGGSILFDGINEYVNLNGGLVLNNWNPDGVSASTSYRGYSTVNIWFKSATISTSGVGKLLFSDNFTEYGFVQNNSTFYAQSYSARSTTITANRWYNACFTANVGRPTSGTFSQSGTTTVFCNTTYPVTFSTGNTVYVSFIKNSGTGVVPVSQNYVVTVTGTNSFEVTAASAELVGGTMAYSSSTNQSTVTLYVNGTLIGSSTGNTGNGANDAPFNIARDNGSATSYWNGNIASFQLYNRMLSTGEILQNHNALKTRFGI